MTTGQAFQEDKDRLRAKLDGVVAPEVLADVMGVCDRWHHEVHELAAAGRAMERLCRAHGIYMDKAFPEYMLLYEEERRRFKGDYVYEYQLDELLDEAEGASDGR